MSKIDLTSVPKTRIRSASMLVVLLLILAVSFASYKSLRDLLDAGARLEHTSQVINELTETLSLFKDVQAGARGYIITGDERFLEFYNIAVKEVPTALARLRDLTPDNPGQQQRLGDLERLATDMLAIAGKNVDLRQRQGPGAVSNEVQWHAKTIMDRSRSVVQTMTAEENRLYQLRRDKVSAEAQTTQYFLLAGATGGSAVIFAVFMLMTREMARRREAETALRGMNEELERRVQERTAELELEARTRKTAEEAAEVNAASLQTVLDSSSDGIITIDERGTILTFSRAAERIFQRRADDVFGHDVTVLMPEPYKSEHDEYVGNYLRTGKGKIIGVGPREVVGLRSDGSTFPLELDVSQAEIRGKRTFIGIVRDITQRKAIDLQLRQSQKMEAVGQLTGGVAHDFNNLLTVVVGNLALIDRAVQGEPRLKKQIETAQRAAQRGAELTKRLLAFARRQVLEPEVVDFNTLISGFGDMLHRTLGETIAIETVLEPKLGLTKVDPHQLENALLNLAINARDAMPSGGKLTIETANTTLDAAYAARHAEVNAGPYVLLAVTDTGTGMPPEVAERAFEPFFTTKDVGKGSGLGLSMIYGFVKQSGGHAKIYSEPGHGTTVKLYFPKTESAQARATEIALEENDMPTGTGTILVVEDDSEVRETAIAILSDLGYSVLQAEDGPSALAMIDQGRQVDLLFTDMVMPGGMTGLDLAREAKTRRPALKVLLASGYAEAALARNGNLGHGAQWLSKPYDPPSLARKIRGVLSG